MSPTLSPKPPRATHANISQPNQRQHSSPSAPVPQRSYPPPPHQKPNPQPSTHPMNHKAHPSASQASRGGRCPYRVKRRKKVPCSTPCKSQTFPPSPSLPTPHPPNQPVSPDRLTPHQNNNGPNSQLGAPRLPLAHDLRPRLLRHRNDAPLNATLRPGPAGDNFPRLAAPIGRHDRRRHADQQDGPRPPAGVRPDARSALGDFHGQLRQRGRVLSLQL